MTGPMDLQERVSFTLRALFDRRGYSRYKMNKFEEYDLYARNRDFLGDHGAITFLDTNGRLMALKPDVTLSIVKNSVDLETVQYTNEQLIGTLDEVLRIQSDGRQKRLDAESELLRIENELKQKLLSFPG